VWRGWGSESRCWKPALPRHCWGAAPGPPTCGQSCFSLPPAPRRVGFLLCFGPVLHTGIPAHSVPRWMWQEDLGGIEGSLFAPIINPLQRFLSFFWCICPRGPMAMPCPPTAACAVSICLSQSSVADPSETAHRAQSDPRSDSRVLASVGCSTAEELWGAGERRGGCPSPAQLPCPVLGFPAGKPSSPRSLASFCL